MDNIIKYTEQEPDAHFDISAAVVKQLGEELVTDEVTAIMELVKNAYDADSPWVRIIVAVNDTLSGEFFHQGDKGYILIEDQGFGMNEHEIKRGWMVISLSHKRKLKEQGLKTPEGRTPLGDKGLGRLSTQRLGDRLEMVTGKVQERVFNHIAFDWSDFTEDIPLSKVPFKYKPEEKQVTIKGTKLIVSKLKDANTWEGKGADRFKGQLSQLIFPFQEKRKFHVFLEINGQRIDLDEINEALRSQAVGRFHFSLSGNILTVSGVIKLFKLVGGTPNTQEREEFEQLIGKDAGKDFFEFLIDKQVNKRTFLTDLVYLGKNGDFFKFGRKIDLSTLSGVATILDPNTGAAGLAHPGNFEGEIDDFTLREADTLDSTFDSFAQYRDIVKNQTGVRIFRDGFGIKPFGIEGNDWLKLGSAQTSGRSFYGLRPSNTIGFVAIGANENRHLKEKTDREGFIDSPYSQNFFCLMDMVVDIVNDIIMRTRRSFNDYKGIVAERTGKITDIKETYERLQNTSAEAKRVQRESQKMSSQLMRVSNSVRAVMQKTQEGKIQWQDEEQRHLLSEMDTLIDQAKKMIGQVDSVLEVAKKLEHDANYIRPKVEDLQNQLSEFAELAGLGLTAEALSHEIANILIRVLDQTKTITNQLKGKSQIDVGSVYVYVEYVKTAAQSLRKQLSHLAPSLRYVREKKEEFLIQDYVNEVVSYYRERLKEGIEIQIVREQGFSIQINKGKLTQIVDNILLNAEFWLKERARKEPHFQPKISLEIQDPYLRIWDNGYGIDSHVQERIFQPFVTAKPRQQGRGLGLFIVQQLLDTMNCDIVLLPKRNDQGRRYIFQINFSSIIK